MNNYAKRVIKFAIGAVMVFTFGLFMGYGMENANLKEIQGYLFNDAADALADTTATNANATDANATDANATDANATNANATSANVNDGIINLKSFDLDSKTVKIGDVVNVDIKTTGACLSGASIVFKDSIHDQYFTANVMNISGDQYIVIPSDAVSLGEGTSYSVYSLLLVGTNSDGTTFTKVITSNGEEGYRYDFVDYVTLSYDGEIIPAPTLNNISVNDTTALRGGRVYITYSASVTPKRLSLTFVNTEGYTFNADVSDLASTSPYFKVPSTAYFGEYTLESVFIVGEQSGRSYGGVSMDALPGSGHISLNSDENNSYVFKNSEIDSSIINKIKDAASGSVITVHAADNSLIKEELFEAIKGQKKQLIIEYNANKVIYQGTSITTPKTIDTAITVKTVSEVSAIDELIDQNAVVVNFANNGNLPGTAIVYIKATDELTSQLGNKILVYRYNEETNDFCLIDSEVEIQDGYYRFAINHNSDYLLTNTKLDKSLVALDEEEVVDFNKSNKVYLLLATAGAAVIVATIIVIIAINRKRK